MLYADGPLGAAWGWAGGGASFALTCAVDAVVPAPPLAPYVHADNPTPNRCTHLVAEDFLWLNTQAPLREDLDAPYPCDPLVDSAEVPPPPLPECAEWLSPRGYLP